MEKVGESRQKFSTAFKYLEVQSYTQNYFTSLTTETAYVAKFHICNTEVIISSDILYRTTC